MAEKVCIGCRARHIPVGRQQRCPACAAKYERDRTARRGTRHQRGYTEDFYRLVRAAIAAQPWCSECGATERLTGDHITPLSRGGQNTPDNVRVLCLHCNSARGNKQLPSQIIDSFEQARRHTSTGESTDILIA
jgi:5-methylcytosine-specific restriction endonuclease McrA